MILQLLLSQFRLRNNNCKEKAVTVQIRSLDPQLAELMPINLSGGNNTLLPGKAPQHPPNRYF